MKELLTYLVFSMLSLSPIYGQSSIPVHMDPSADSTQIGELEAAALAVPAEWPEQVAPVNGWQPVFYRGTWDVYVNNSDIAKDLSIKPGSPYFLQASRESQVLSIATKQDQTNIISVDTWFCKIQLQTIVVGYIQNANIAAESIVTSLPSPSAAPGKPKEAAAITELRGIVKTVGMIGKSRTGLAYKLQGSDGKTLAFLDVSGLPERIRVEEMINKEVNLTGVLGETAETADVILTVKTLSLAE